jgi:hypothetical protein
MSADDSRARIMVLLLNRAPCGTKYLTIARCSPRMADLIMLAVGPMLLDYGEFTIPSSYD